MSEYKVYSAPVKSFWCCLPNLALHLWSSITHARVPSIRNRPFFPLLVKTSASWKRPIFKQVTIVPGLVETRVWSPQWLEEKCLRNGSLLRKPSRTWEWWYFPIRRQEGKRVSLVGCLIRAVADQGGLFLWLFIQCCIHVISHMWSTFFFWDISCFLVNRTRENRLIGL